MQIFFTIVEIVLCVFIIGAVLLQSGKSAGLSGSIGGAADSFVGGKKKGLDSFLSKTTAILAVIFFVVCVLVNILVF